MAERSWFFASNGQQQGPYGEAQFRDFVAQGSIGPDTLVWSEGMSGWQKAGDVPGLMTGGARPPALPYEGPPPGRNQGDYVGGQSGGTLAIDFGIGEFAWRSLVFILGMAVVIPAPWVLCWYLRWFVPCVHVPGRPNLSFTGQPGMIAKWYFGAIAIIILGAVAAAIVDSQVLSNAVNFVQIVLYWLVIRYLIANLASNGQPLGFTFSGTFWAFLGYTLLALIAFVTIIGWAWVYVAQIRWFCRNIQGTRRQVIFKGSGAQFLWRAIVAGLLSVLIIPIPWVYRWMMRWMASQTVLVERN
jgi:GYF domain 2